MAGALDAERTSRGEQAAFLGEAERQLKEAFALASQGALAQNNQMFLDLAQAKFAELQNSARTDLDAQQSIDLLVRPVNDGLRCLGERHRDSETGEWKCVISSRMVAADGVFVVGRLS